MVQTSKHNNSAPTGKELRLAIIHILISALCFAFMTFFVRISGDLPTMEKAFFRNFVALFIAVYALVQKGTGFRVVEKAKASMFLRCLFGTTGLIANFWAIDHLGIADANMLNKLSPFFAIIMSYFIMKEIPNKIDWLCVILAFSGALFIIKPGLGFASLPALVGLYGGFGAGTAYAYVHKMGKLGQPGPTIVFYFSLFSCLLTLPFMIAQWKPITLWQLGCLIMAGISAAIAQFNITAAYQLAPAKSISVFDYTQVIFAAILGFLFLSEIPDIFSFIGYAVIIFAAIFKWEYGRRTSEQ
jgi:drug/metabolite transporter (DMT)-like permease